MSPAEIKHVAGRFAVGAVASVLAVTVILIVCVVLAVTGWWPAGTLLGTVQFKCAALAMMAFATGMAVRPQAARSQSRQLMWLTFSALVLGGIAAGWIAIAQVERVRRVDAGLAITKARSASLQTRIDQSAINLAAQRAGAKIDANAVKAEVEALDRENRDNGREIAKLTSEGSSARWAQSIADLWLGAEMGGFALLLIYCKLKRKAARPG